jgi:hypothetical protein
MSKSLLLFTAVCLGLSAVSAGAQNVPDEKELKSLTRDSLLSFNQAVQAKDFTAFQKQIAAMWQAQVTPTKLKSIFQTFIDQEIDLTGIKSVDPEFSEPPEIDDRGVLVLKGSYPTTPTKVNFELKYLNEKKAWKLIGIDVNVSPSAPAGELPSEEEMTALVQESLSAFNAAVQTESFVDFHKQIAVLWQKQVTPEKLNELFASFIKQKIDISEVATMEPTFEKPPAINDDGILEVRGSYSIEPNIVTFDLAYLFEEPDWKLVKVNVKIRPADEDKPKKGNGAAKK